MISPMQSLSADLEDYSIGLYLTLFGGVSYYKANRALDLTSAFDLTLVSVADQSGNGNNGVAYTGRFFSTNGTSSDKPIKADCTAHGASTFKLTGKVRSSTTGTKFCQLNGSTSLSITVAGADVWEDFESTTSSSVIASDVSVGNNGAAYSACDWSDVRLVDTATNSTVAHWEGSVSAAASLTPVPCIDSGGSGYHGSFTGCAGGTGEGMDAEVARVTGYDDAPFFDGVTNYVSFSDVVMTGDFFVSFSPYILSIATEQNLIASNNVNRIRILSGGSVRVQIDDSYVFTSATASNGVNSFRLERVGTTLTLTVNGVSESITSGTQDFTISAVSKESQPTLHGLMLDLNIDDQLAYTGRGASPWIDTIGSRDGVQHGVFKTVAQLRSTIIQTAGQGWNRGFIFNATANAKIDMDSPIIPATDDFDIDLWVSHANGSTSELRNVVSQYDSAEEGRVLIQCRNNNIRLFIGGTVSVAIEGGSFLPNRVSHLQISRVSTLFTVTLDGVTVGTATSSVSISQDANTWIAESPASSARELNGSVAGTVNGANISTGTPVGASISAYMIPASDTTPSVDALGVAIANPRPSSLALNIFSADETVNLADVTALESVRSLTIALYNDGGTSDILQDSGGGSFVDVATNTLQSDQTGAHAYYVNGVSTTTLPAGWCIVGITFASGKDLSGGKIVSTSGALIAYSPTALTSAIHLQNYNALKSKF